MDAPRRVPRRCCGDSCEGVACGLGEDAGEVEAPQKLDGCTLYVCTITSGPVLLSRVFIQ